MINPGTILFCTPHPVWSTAAYSPQAAKMAISKVRFLTNTLMTGDILNKMYGRSPSCLCRFPVEDRFHLSLDCSIYADLRQVCITQIKTTIMTNYPQVLKEDITNRNGYVISHLILDATWYRQDIGSSLKGFPNIFSKQVASTIETISRIFCFKIYRRRFELLSENSEEPDSDEETDCSDFYSLHDTSSSSSSNTSYEETD